MIPNYRTSVLKSPGTIEIEERQIPSLNPWELLIRPTLAGLCGTDIAIFKGTYKVPLPLVLGHEFIGVVEEVGEEVDKKLKGRRVTSEINFTCLSRGVGKKTKTKADQEICDACKVGIPTHCQKRTVLGIINQPGVFAERVVVPVGNIHLIPDELPPELALFIEPLAAAIQTFEMAPLGKDQTVLILGLGRLGTLVAIVAKVLGAKVIALSGQSRRLDQIRALGIENNLLTKGLFFEKIKEKVMELTRGIGADVVVEATGSPAGINQALEFVRPRGTISIKTTSGVPPAGLDMTKAVVNEIRIQGSRCGPFDKAIDFLVKNKPDLPSLISRGYPLEKLEEALLETSKPTDKIEKTIITLQ